MEDIDLLIERINNLVEELRKAYRLELDEIEVMSDFSKHGPVWCQRQHVT